MNVNLKWIYYSFIHILIQLQYYSCFKKSNTYMSNLNNNRKLATSLCKKYSDCFNCTIASNGECNWRDEKCEDEQYLYLLYN